MISEIGEELRRFINQTKEYYRIKMREQRKDKLVELTEIKAYRTLNLRTNRIVGDNQGNKMINEDTGQYILEENARIITVPMNTVKYMLDRLNRISYGK